MEITIGSSNVFVRFREGKKGAPSIWFVHGFGDSGFCFLEAFSDPSLRNYSLFVPDFPGFGVSPQSDIPHNIDQSAVLLETLVAAYSKDTPIVLVGHSLGGLIATKVAMVLKEKILCFINVEGNVVKADTFYSSKAAKASDPIQWKENFTQEIYQLGFKDESLRRYYISVKEASPASLYEWAKSGVEGTGEDLGGRRFLQVSSPTLYIYGRKSISAEAKVLLETHKVKMIKFENSGHWPMIDETERFYRAVANFITEVEV